MTSFYPLIFEPIYLPKMWGGRRFATLFKRQLPPGEAIGESWEISDRPDAASVVAAGDFAGKTLTELRENYPEELFGEQVDEFRDRFPLLLKFINAEDPLSLQVHPDNRYALKYENDCGKAEAWYIVDAMPGANITRGFKAGITRDKAVKAINKDHLESIVDNFEVAAGDATFISPGTIHGIGSGVVLAEIQQNSDVTYRAYDYNRLSPNGKPRELHTDKVIEVLSFRDPGSAKVKPVKIDHLHSKLTACDHFSMYRYDFREPIHEYSINRFRILCNIEGHGTIISPEGLFEDVEFHPGTSILIPAAVIDFSLVPATHCVMLDIIPGKFNLKKDPNSK
jgi:mannose-6-phosphate isomerase